MSEKMPAATLEALIERLEKCSGPDRELDAEIARTVGWLCVGYRRPSYREIVGTPPTIGGVKGRGILKIPAYTASLDAAMTLVPDDAWLQMSWPQSERAYGYSREEDRIAKATLQFAREPYIAGATHATPSIAICIAALRARSA